MHAHQAVHNVPTLLRRREAIYHVHAKDTRLGPSRQALTGRLETLPVMAAKDRSWNYVTLGYGHDDAFWRAFCLAPRRVAPFEASSYKPPQI